VVSSATESGSPIRSGDPVENRWEQAQEDDERDREVERS
jgi:hypothetical protein